MSETSDLAPGERKSRPLQIYSACALLFDDEPSFQDADPWWDGKVHQFYRIKGYGQTLLILDNKYIPIDIGRVSQLMGVTALGGEKHRILKEFMENVPSKLQALIDEYPVLFAPPDQELLEHAVKHMIYVLLEHVPAARNAYPLSGTKLQAMREQMRELVAKGWVGPSESPWAAPILFVGKDRGQSLRICIDFRDLNALTVRDRFPLLRLDLLLYKAVNARIFSKLDLASGYHQIEVYPPHRELTAFVLPESIKGHALWE